ncbi:MAG: hypothetical protein LWW86_13775 [Micrococcales bacterium]|nr:hypothetical protein [Micrococcales bacterium]
MSTDSQTPSGMPRAGLPAEAPVGLTPAQQRGLLRLGDVVIPGDGDLPSFSESGCADGIDRMLPYMYEADRSSLLTLLEACARLPRPAIRRIVAIAAAADRFPEPAAGVFRLANIGIKGVVQSLYWSDIGTGGVHLVIGHDATINEAAYEAALKETER